MTRLLVILTLVAALAGCGGDEEPAPAAAQDGTSAEVREVRDGVAALLDVRTEIEHDVARATNALHIPLDEIEQGERPDVAKDARLYVFCRTGRRAAQAVTLLERDGWTDVVNVGGLDDWERMGGAIERGP